MNKLALLLTAATLAACSQQPAADNAATPAPASESAAAAPAQSSAEAERADLQARRDKIAKIDMVVDTSFLTDEQRQVVNLLNQAANEMSKIYLRQRWPENPDIRATITASNDPNKDLLLNLFDLNFGPWDALDHDKPFYGDMAWPKGAGFYPADMTRDEFDAWIDAHPDDKAAFNSPYTVIRRTDDGGLKAVPYSVEYKEFLEPAAEDLRKAAEITTNPSLKKFLSERADAFVSDDYYQSELAWMDLKGTPIEVAIGPYEVYTDRLFGMKTAFEAFVTIKNPEESAALAKYKDYLRDMEANLPVDDSYKNFDRGFESPIAVTYQVHGGGDNVPGVQTIAFNLPNDERVREAKGAKKVLLNNVLGAKFERILQPMAEHVLVPDQSALLMKKYMSAETLFHELSHSMGPGALVIDGRETTVSAELKDLYSAIEEGKADVMGAYNVLYMMQRGEMPEAEKNNFLATYFVGVFRAMRFGTNEAHGKGAAFQYSYFRQVGAAQWDAEAKRFRVDFPKLEQAISDLTGKVVVIEGNGSYDDAKSFLDTMGHADADADAVIASMTDIPVDIQPIYPDKL